MNTTIQLVAQNGNLYFPFGGYDDSLRRQAAQPNLLLKMYDAGDCDCIPWPLVPAEYSNASVSDLEQRLASALYDERESNEFFPVDAVIELPDGGVFNFDMLLG